ncbi:isoprenylcysteine carboxylmethyltransferase family protein [Fontimonas sp. SYSU GA230001]|uniref:methyltransferase family protein n=1 Tax=Fontimonas sp. SYSU GA230001 TaxID=3142450 RepID=UPI0032B548E4
MLQFIERHRIVLSRLMVAGVLVVLAISSSAWSGRQAFFASVLVALGLVLIGLAMVGRLWCNLYIVGYKNQTLLTTGPYSASRNPLYFFSSLGGVGVGLTSGTLTVGVLIAVLFALTYPGVILTEEKRLEKIHGQAWLDYMARVPRFFPRLSQLVEPEQYEVHPRLFRKHLLDALWFAWAAGVMALIDGAHGMGWLPNYLLLP